MLTKRLTVPAAEELLYKEQSLPDGYVRLVDYMGGDETIIYAATAGIGKEAFEGDAHALFSSLHSKRAYRFPQIKLHFNMPIHDALFWVYREAFHINEYSARYSVLPDTTKNVGFREEQKMDREEYDALLELGLARELARSVLGTYTHTECYISASLLDWLHAVGDAKKLAKDYNQLGETAEEIERVLRAVAPVAVQAYHAPQGTILPNPALLNLPPQTERYPLTDTKRFVNNTAESLLFKPIKYLENMWFMPVGYMGGDDAIVQSARVSYGKGTKKANEDRGLIRYLRRHRHTTPFEHVHLHGELTAPEFVFPRQLGRHRTMAKEGFLEEFLCTDQHYTIPEDQLRVQSSTNKQGRGEILKSAEVREILARNAARKEKLVRLLSHKPRGFVDGLKGTDYIVRGSIAVDLHNAFHYCRLRLDSHAQWEIQKVSEPLATFIQALAPVAYEAWEDYERHAVTFSRQEREILKKMLSRPVTKEWLEELGLVQDGKESREVKEFREKLS